MLDFHQPLAKKAHLITDCQVAAALPWGFFWELAFPVGVTRPGQGDQGAGGVQRPGNDQAQARGQEERAWKWDKCDRHSELDVWLMEVIVHTVLLISAHIPVIRCPISK